MNEHFTTFSPFPYWIFPLDLIWRNRQKGDNEGGDQQKLDDSQKYSWQFTVPWSLQPFNTIWQLYGCSYVRPISVKKEDKRLDIITGWAGVKSYSVFRCANTFGFFLWSLSKGAKQNVILSPTFALFCLIFPWYLKRASTLNAYHLMYRSKCVALICFHVVLRHLELSPVRLLWEHVCLWGRFSWVCIYSQDSNVCYKYLLLSFSPICSSCSLASCWVTGTDQSNGRGNESRHWSAPLWTQQKLYQTILNPITLVPVGRKSNNVHWEICFRNCWEKKRLWSDN